MTTQDTKSIEETINDMAEVKGTEVVSEMVTTEEKVTELAEVVPPADTDTEAEESTLDAISQAMRDAGMLGTNDKVNHSEDKVVDLSIESTTEENDSIIEKDNNHLEAMLTEEINSQNNSEDTKREEIVNPTLKVMKEIAKENHKGGESSGKLKGILDSVLIDVDNIKIVDSDTNPIEMQQNISALKRFNTTPSIPVMALKSGYRASLAALNNNEKIAIRNVKGSAAEQNKRILELIWSKITDTSIGGRPSYNEWLKITAEDDFDTLMYGIYASTFPNPVEYNVGCPHCQKSNTLKLRPENLIEVIDQERAGNYVRQVIENYSKGKEFLKESLVASKTKKILPESKIIVEIIVPSLQDMLDNMHTLQRLEKAYEPELVMISKYISKVMIPNLDAFSLGRAEYFEQKDKSSVIDTLCNSLSGNDLKDLKKIIAQNTAKYLVNYRIPSFTCANRECSKEIKNATVDMVNIVFTSTVAEEIMG